jgi:hypothetical protein
MLRYVLVSTFYAWTASPLLLLLSPWLSLKAIALLLAFAMAHVAFIRSLYAQWFTDIAPRKHRSDPASPSHRVMPKPDSVRNCTCPSVVLENSPIEQWSKKRAEAGRDKGKQPMSGEEVGNGVADKAGEQLTKCDENCSAVGSDDGHSGDSRRGSAASGVISGFANFVRRRSRLADAIRRFSASMGATVLSSSTEACDELDLNHVRISFDSFVWGHYSVAPPAVALWVSGVATLLFRMRLYRLGLLSPVPHDPARVVGQLVLEGMNQVVQYTGRVTHATMEAGDTDGDDRSSSGEEGDGQDRKSVSDKNNRCVAVFQWFDFPIFDNSGAFDVKTRMIIFIDLNTKRMCKASLDDEPLTAKEAMILIWFHTIGAGHVKSHAYGNWGVNVEGKSNKFAKQNGVVTVLYNYFGRTVFTRLCAYWYNWGLTEHSFGFNFARVLDHGVKQGIHDHEKVRELVHHSEVTNFVVKTRNKFLQLFKEHKNSMMGIDGEAMYIGSVIHSLDHTLMEWNLQDPLWLDVDCAKFGLMAEFGRIVRVGFVEDIPMLTFNKNMRTAPHKFYKDFYAHAARINRKMADHMDTCIVK